MGVNNQPWPQEQEDELRRLFHFKQDGYYLSHTLIAAAMPQVTRGAVIGKIRRLKLERDKDTPYLSANGMVIDPTVTDFKSKDGDMSNLYNGPRTTSAKPKVYTGAGEFVGVTSPTACQVVGLSNSVCHFPVGHVGKEGFHFCGAETKTGPYCALHTSICIRPLERRGTPRPTYRR